MSANIKKIKIMLLPFFINLFAYHTSSKKLEFLASASVRHPSEAALAYIRNEVADLF